MTRQDLKYTLSLKHSYAFNLQYDLHVINIRMLVYTSCAIHHGIKFTKTKNRSNYLLSLNGVCTLSCWNWINWKVECWGWSECLRNNVTAVLCELCNYYRCIIFHKREKYRAAHQSKFSGQRRSKFADSHICFWSFQKKDRWLIFKIVSMVLKQQTENSSPE